MNRLLQGFLVLCLVMILCAAWDLFNEARTLTWKSVPARITHSEVVVVSVTQSVTRNARPADRVWYQWNLQYTCRVDGLDYVADRRSFRDTPIRNETSAHAMAAKYPVGSDVMAYVSPDDPAFSVLEPGFFALSVVVMLGALIGAVGTVWVMSGINAVPRRRR